MQKKRRIIGSCAAVALIGAVAAAILFMGSRETTGSLLVDGLIPEPEYQAGGFTGRNTQVQTDAYSLVYDRADGRQSLFVFASPVQFQAENGSWKLIDNTLVEATSPYLYQNNQNDIRIRYPDLKEETAFLLKYGSNTIHMGAIASGGTPKKQTGTTVFGAQQEMVRYSTDPKQGVSVSYYTTNLGLKCQMTFTKPVEQAQFSFTMDAGLSLDAACSRYFALRDADNRVAALLYQPVVIDGDGLLLQPDHAFLTLEQGENGQYRVTLQVNELDAGRRNPYTLEFTLHFYKGNQVDSTIRSTAPNENSYLDNLLIASDVQTYGQAESYVRFENHAVERFVSEHGMQSANYTFYGLAKEEQAALSLYRCDSHWSSTKITWNTRQVFDMRLSNVAAIGSHAYRADVTELVRQWPQSPVQKDLGFLLRAQAGQMEAFASGDNGAMAPRLEIVGES